MKKETYTKLPKRTQEAMFVATIVKYVLADFLPKQLTKQQIGMIDTITKQAIYDALLLIERDWQIRANGRTANKEAIVKVNDYFIDLIPSHWKPPTDKRIISELKTIQKGGDKYELKQKTERQSILNRISGWISHSFIWNRLFRLHRDSKS